ncbi:MAG: hypothetical protein RHS_4807 [Robinsoniella sp. RHS]|nr:MAG: hypothetical protein RHS_4807 [Robinsoniella sp. RHS]
MYGKMGVGNWHGLRQLAAELLYASYAHTSFPHPSFRDSVY